MPQRDRTGVSNIARIFNTLETVAMAVVPTTSANVVSLYYDDKVRMYMLRTTSLVIYDAPTQTTHQTLPLYSDL
jgi:hypothetical protein